MELLRQIDVSYYFDRGTYGRGVDYFRSGRVIGSNLEEDGTITGRVRGQGRSVYEVKVTIRKVGKQQSNSLKGTCTCPVGVNCKHVVAVLLTVKERTAVVSVPRTAPSNPNLSPALSNVLIDQWLNTIQKRMKDASSDLFEGQMMILYTINIVHSGQHPVTSITLTTGKYIESVGVSLDTPIKLANLIGKVVAPYVTAQDLRIAESLDRNFPKRHPNLASFYVEGYEGARHLEMVLSTGRVVWQGNPSRLLTHGDPRPVTFRWVAKKNGNQELQIDNHNLCILPTMPPYFVDSAALECGLLDTQMSTDLFSTLLQAPEVAPEFAGTVRSQIASMFPDRPDLLPEERTGTEIILIRPIPVLSVSRKVLTERHKHSWMSEKHTVVAPVAILEFLYGETKAVGLSQDIRKTIDGVTRIIPRRPEVEESYRNRLAEMGWSPSSDIRNWSFPKAKGESFGLPPIGFKGSTANEHLYQFLHSSALRLAEEGWQLHIDANLQAVALEDIQWNVGVKQEGTDWFNLELGIVVNGEAIDLRHVLLEALQYAAREAKRGKADEIDDDVVLFHETKSGKVLPIPFGRLKPLLRALEEIFGPPSEWSSSLKLARNRGLEIAALDQAAHEAGLRLRTPVKLQKMLDRLESFHGLVEIERPVGLCAELRPYQMQGVSWLQFLAEFGFGGILADDMGLGKTIQTIAHLLIEKAAGRMTKPALIIGPTSTLPNWKHEVARFAPEFKVLVLHGANRAKEFAKIPHSNIVLTSYPLLSRDREELSKHSFHTVVLDEAQNIKNPTTAMAKAASELVTDHRLCLSGTPIENNLDELWSLFNFVSPGLLGGLTQFRQAFRNPIEQGGDEAARARLVRRTRPFILRRTKELVASELPEKTEVVEWIDLKDKQRDLYESVRLAMDKRVRELLEAKGFEKSRIEMLDALLKLRQVCCDPRLVKLESASEVRESAKLERLMEMLEELGSRGSRVLLFSQFTSMLDLIEGSLRERNIDWVRISGDTKDRDTPVKRFQSGEVPLFLISLKAGGTGLNLTAADTVIHYDPWWNPAVERQATDRAHRIGQDKPVFVYKLVATGSVEEKILELQNRKAKLADSLLDDSGEIAEKLTAEDLRWVLSPAA